MSDCFFFRIAKTPQEKREVAIHWEKVRASTTKIRDASDREEEAKFSNAIKERQRLREEEEERQRKMLEEALAQVGKTSPKKSSRECFSTYCPLVADNP